MKEQKKAGERKKIRNQIIIQLFLVLAVIYPAYATTVNWNSKVIDDVEYYVQTDKSTYLLGEDVELLYRITNLGQESITYTVGWSPIWNFWAETNGQCIWTGMYSKLAVITSLTIGAGESIEFPEFNPPFTWDLRDDAYDLVKPGEYDVIGGIDHSENYYDFTKVSVKIEVIPEPATLSLFGGYALLFIIFSKKKQNSSS